MYKLTYKDKEYEFKTKKEALSTLIQEYNLKPTDYICFYIWSYRVCKNNSWEDKIKLYLDYRILRKELNSYKDK